MGFMPYYKQNLSDYSSLHVPRKEEPRTLQEESMLVGGKVVLPQGPSSVRLTLPPRSATLPVALRDSLGTAQHGCHLVLLNRKVKRDGRATDLYMAYAIHKEHRYFLKAN